ncbi:M23 family metallopeptidase [Aquabacter sp. L1I39]|uniref:M23 family metallopeptidase n=1 Tax=Aquabacter sp. L1I39 TaxID=2820278 RepID=UPI001FFC5BBE|nr:M23 family metallopeptidase [Aquabacter sp. L1I39]
MASQEVTGSLGAAPTGRVDSAPIGGEPLGVAAGAPPTAYAAPTAPAAQPLSGTAAYNTAPPYGSTSVPRQPAGATHVVVGGETLTSIARSYNTTPAHLASVNGISQDAMLRVGQTLIVPPGASGNLAQIRPAPTPAKPSVVTAPAPVAASQPAPAIPAQTPTLQAAPTLASTLQPAKPATKPGSVPAASATPAPAAAAAPTSIAAATAPAAPAKSTTATATKTAAAEEAEDAPRAPGSGPQFRAPVRGRVISGFGPKPGGARNDGVNFAVPEGTAVRAAEDGTVAYAGNELKGYGNLVLIKHADGYVTAYAHNSELMVKKGDTIRRGQIIAKAGQTGGVTTPQLHFEIRKGSQPVDPSQYVAGL